jgi:hypothetical protein
MTRTARILCLVAAPAIVAAAASTAYGHARLMTPTPRDNRDGYKDMTPPGTGAPCGIVRAASQPSSNLTAGATLNLAWEETIDHPGCFVIDFSAANDQDFQIIGRKSHANPPAKTGNPGTRKYTMSVTLPSTPCTACTLRLRQMMLSADVPEANLATACPPATIPANVTYYSCANVVLGGGGASGTGGAGGGAGGATGSAGRGGNAGGGRGGGSAAGGGGGAGGSSSAGQAGSSGQGGSGTTGQAGSSGEGGSGTTGQAGTSGQGGSGTTGQAGTSGQAGSGSTGQAGTTGQSGSNGQGGATGQAGNGSSGAAGATGTGGTGGDDGGGCQTGGGVTAAPLGLLLSAILISRGRRRSRS